MKITIANKTDIYINGKYIDTAERVEIYKDDKLPEDVQKLDDREKQTTLITINVNDGIQEKKEDDGEVDGFTKFFNKYNDSRKLRNIEDKFLENK
jgi:hypothetical protein